MTKPGAPGKPFLTPKGTIVGKADPGPFSGQPGPDVPHLAKENPNGAGLPANNGPKPFKAEPRR
jgi:hypothetical protein